MSTTALYFSPQPTRSARARWAFIEAGVEFEKHVVDIFKGEHKHADYLAVNPLGFVPAATFDGAVVIESSALALMAATQHPKANLLPEVGSLAWRQALQWVVFAPAELDRLLATLNQHTRFREPAKRDAELVAETVSTFDARAQLVANALGDEPFLLGKTFSVADICVGHSLVWATMIERLDNHPALKDYVTRLQSRPAFQEVYGPEIHVFPDPHA